MKNLSKIVLVFLCTFVLVFTCISACACHNGPPADDPTCWDGHVWVQQSTNASGLVDIQTEYKCSHCNQTKTVNAKNVVLIIGDGMGPEHITAGEYAVGKQFFFRNWCNANVNTDNVLGELTDSAAAGTALATGTLTSNGRVGRTKDGVNLTTILDAAKAVGKKTGIVTTDYLYGATPGAFSAHASDRNETAKIINSQASSGVDLLCSASSGDVLSCVDTFTQNGYAFCDDISKSNEQLQNSSKALCQLSLEGYGGEVPLCDAAQFALNYLQNDNGFVLMIEQAHIDKHSHNNSMLDMCVAMDSFQKTVSAVAQWADSRDDTAILITADHETGGLQLSQTDVAPFKPITISNTFYYNWTSTSHTRTNVKLYYFGFSANLASLPTYSDSSRIKNAEIFTLMQALLSAM